MECSVVRRGGAALILGLLSANVTVRAEAAPSSEQLVQMIAALQARVDSLEKQARRDRADAAAARAELHALNAKRKLTTEGSDSEPTRVPHRIAQESVNDTFLGGYVAAIGGYGFGRYSRGSYGAISGSSLGLAIGYNAISEPVLIGFEGRSRYSPGDAAVTGGFQGPSRDFPIFLASVCCGPFPPGYHPSGSVSRFNLSNSSLYKTRLSREFATDISTRVGLTIGETLIYSRTGVGVELLRSSFRQYNSSTDCVNPVVFTTGTIALQDSIVGCGAVETKVVPFKSASSQFAPYAIFGMGVERNFGSFFARLEANVLGHFGPPKDIFTYQNFYFSTEINSAVGYRF